VEAQQHMQTNERIVYIHCTKGDVMLLITINS
jgi:hypothetical protein